MHAQQTREKRAAMRQRHLRVPRTVTPSRQVAANAPTPAATVNACVTPIITPVATASAGLARSPAIPVPSSKPQEQPTSRRTIWDAMRAAMTFKRPHDVHQRAREAATHPQDLDLANNTDSCFFFAESTVSPASTLPAPSPQMLDALSARSSAAGSVNLAGSGKTRIFYSYSDAAPKFAAQPMNLADIATFPEMANMLSTDIHTSIKELHAIVEESRITFPDAKKLYDHCLMSASERPERLSRFAFLQSSTFCKAGIQETATDLKLVDNSEHKVQILSNCITHNQLELLAVALSVRASRADILQYHKSITTIAREVRRGHYREQFLEKLRLRMREIAKYADYAPDVLTIPADLNVEQVCDAIMTTFVSCREDFKAGEKQRVQDHYPEDNQPRGPSNGWVDNYKLTLQAEFYDAELKVEKDDMADPETVDNPDSTSKFLQHEEACTAFWTAQLKQRFSSASATDQVMECMQAVYQKIDADMTALSKAQNGRQATLSSLQAEIEEHYDQLAAVIEWTQNTENGTKLCELADGVLCEVSPARLRISKKVLTDNNYRITFATMAVSSSAYDYLLLHAIDVNNPPAIRMLVEAGAKVTEDLCWRALQKEHLRAFYELAVRSCVITNDELVKAFDIVKGMFGSIESSMSSLNDYAADILDYFQLPQSTKSSVRVEVYEPALKEAVRLVGDCIFSPHWAFLTKADATELLQKLNNFEQVVVGLREKLYTNPKHSGTPGIQTNNSRIMTLMGYVIHGAKFDDVRSFVTKDIFALQKIVNRHFATTL